MTKVGEARNLGLRGEMSPKPGPPKQPGPEPGRDPAGRWDGAAPRPEAALGRSWWHSPGLRLLTSTFCIQTPGREGEAAETAAGGATAARTGTGPGRGQEEGQRGPKEVWPGGVVAPRGVAVQEGVAVPRRRGSP